MRSPRLLAGIAASTVFVGFVLAALLVGGVHEHLISFFVRLEGMGIWALFVFVLLMALVVVFLLPGAPFTTGAGFVFGLAQGTIAVVVGTTIGAVLAFLAARYLVGAQAARRLRRQPRLRAIDEELTASGWKAVLFVRLVPFFPSKLANYVFGLTQVPLRAYATGTFIGVIPLSLHNVYIGAMAAAMSAWKSRRPRR